MGVILAFPEDDFAPPPRINWRDWARGQIDTLRDRRARRARKAVEVDSRASDAQNRSQGRDSCWTEPDTSVTAVSDTLEQPDYGPPSCESVTVGGAAPWATARDRAASTTMRELTPVLLDDDERGEGDSTNARMHRVIKRGLR